MLQNTKTFSWLFCSPGRAVNSQQLGIDHLLLLACTMWEKLAGEEFATEMANQLGQWPAVNPKPLLLLEKLFFLNPSITSFQRSRDAPSGCAAATLPGHLFPVARNLLGKQLGWFPDAGLKKKKIISLRERARCQNLALAV